MLFSTVEDLEFLVSLKGKADTVYTYCEIGKW